VLLALKTEEEDHESKGVRSLQKLEQGRKWFLPEPLERNVALFILAQ
jgi:hypothetical protein